MQKKVQKSGGQTQAEKIKEKARVAQETKLQKKDMEIEGLAPEVVLGELKNKGLPVFGTAGERKDRLKKYYGIVSGGSVIDQNTVPMQIQTPELPKFGKRSDVVGKIEEMKQRRDERRRKMEEEKKMKIDREAENLAAGKMGDVDFELMIDKYRLSVDRMKPHISPDSLKLNVCVRKRPIFKKESSAGEIDCVSVANPTLLVHECKLRVDGISKYLENHEFHFDNAFSEKESSEDLYTFSIRPLIPLLFDRGVVTCFAYGQTGSGKTYTMQGLQSGALHDLFEEGHRRFKGALTYSVSFFEIYGGRLFDLLNERNLLQLLEDRNHEVQVQGLVEQTVESAEEMNRVSFHREYFLQNPLNREDVEKIINRK